MRNHILKLITIIIPGMGLGIFAFLGYFGRMFTDDFCYSYSYNSLGLIGTLRGYYFIMTFTAHRYSLTFFEWVIDRFGIPGIQWMPFIFILLWWSGVYLLTIEINKRTGENLGRIEIAALTSILLFFSIYLAPNLYQSLYWRTGILPYTAPLIAGIWLLVFLFHSQLSNSFAKYLILGLGGFIAAGFSEAGAVFIGVIFSIIIAWSIWSLLCRNKMPWLSLGRPGIVCVAAIIAALVIMYLSPINHQRQISYQAPASIGMTFLFACRFAFDFIWLSFRTQPLPNIAFCIIASGIGFLSEKSNAFDFKWVIRITILSLLSAFLVIWVLHLPSAYVEKSPPAERTLIMARFILLVSELVIFYFSGLWLAGFRQNNVLQIASVILVAVGLVYVVRTEIITIQYQFPRFQKVAQVWDQRDSSIRAARQRGDQKVDVQPIDSQYIGGLLELYPSPNWVNLCASQYYGVKEILATLDW